jgi:hypothetical protein
MSEPAELKSANQIAAELQGTADSPEEQSNPKDEKRYSFEFSHTDSRGKVFRGTFVNEILSIRQRRLMKITKARLSGNVTVGALDADIWELNEMIAHLTISLDKSADGFPRWAEDLEGLYDESVIQALYEEVASHEARFHRRDAAAEAGSRPGKDGVG